jgi:hypothetical protein
MEIKNLGTIGNQTNIDKNEGQVNIASGNPKIIANQNLDNKALNGINMNEFIEELNKLKSELGNKELYDEASSVKKAIETKEEVEKISFLKNAGIKALEVSKEVCLPVVTIVLTKILGL